MPQKWTVSETGITEISGRPCWQITLLRPDGAKHLHLMPGATLEWRAAEYGVDPKDVDTLLEIVLHEPHMQTVDNPQHGPRYADSGPDLWTADSTDAARTAHLARVQACSVRIDVTGVQALDTIRTGHTPDPDRIRAMRETVDTNRWLKKHGGFPQPPLPQTPAALKEAARA